MYNSCGASFPVGGGLYRLGCDRGKKGLRPRTQNAALHSRRTRTLFRRLEIPTENGKISAWFIPAQKDKDSVSESMQTVIVSHNYSDNREMNDISLLYTVKFLSRNGLNVVMFDYTGSGSSDGKGYSFGQKEETEELCAVTDKIKELYSGRRNNPLRARFRSRPRHRNGK